MAVRFRHRILMRWSRTKQSENVQRMGRERDNRRRVRSTCANGVEGASPCLARAAASAQERRVTATSYRNSMVRSSMSVMTSIMALSAYLAGDFVNEPRENVRGLTNDFHEHHQREVHEVSPVSGGIEMGLA